MGRDRSRDRDRRDRKSDRKRSRSRDRKRSRSRSPKRDERSRDRKRARSRDRSDRNRSKDRDREVERKEPEFEFSEAKSSDFRAMLDTKDKAAAQELDKIMEDRRKKVELWRAKKKKTKEAEIKVEEQEQEKMIAEENKMWNLEDDNDDDESTSKATEIKKEEPEVEEEDPLDAFMNTLSTNKKKPAEAKGTRIVTIVSKEVPEKDKGELMENDDNADVVIEDFDIEKVTSLCHKGRMLAQTDHEMVYYRSFRKNFYTETPEVANMSDQEVAEYRKELDDITIKGKNPPKPVRAWSQCGVDMKTLTILKKHGYTKPTPIQAQAIPCIMSGRDVIGIAKTGSGKTLAFLLPMLRHIRDQHELEEGDGPIAVIMAPTRELAMQTWKEANKFAKQHGLRVVCVYGGVGISEQIADLKRGAEIIVCTPGRMIDMLAANSGKVTNLRRVTYLVLDEADRMFDMGFEPQVMKIVNNIRPDRQTVLFSATFPRQMEALARKILDAPLEISVGGKSVVCSDVTQCAVIVDEMHKPLKLLELLGIYYEAGASIIFVDKQEKADDIVGILIKAGYTSVAPLHGGIDQFDRDSTINDFKTGVIKVLIATSVAARGLDVKNLILVVNYDCPNHYEDYVHRCGRTGRAGRKGYAYTFILPQHQEKMAGEVCRAFTKAGAEPPSELVAMFNRFKEEMEKEGKTIHLGGKGFAGSGYKYDDNEAEADANKKKLQRLVHGMEAGGDDDDDLDEQLNSLIKTKRRVVQGQMTNDGVDNAQQPTSSRGKTANKIALAKERAEALADKLKSKAQPVEKDVLQTTAELIMKGGELAPIEISKMMVAKKLADRLNEKLNYVGGESTHGKMEGDDWEYYEEEWDINDFPQQVRFKICSRESVANVAEYADVGISVRGSHYPPGREPKNGEKRLHLLLEARSERNLRKAKDEIVRIMRDSFKQLAGSARGGMQARYKV